MKKLVFLSLYCLCAITAIAKDVTDKYRSQHVTYAKQIVARVVSLPALDPKNEVLRDACSYFGQHFCVGYLPLGTMTVRFFQACPKPGAFALLPLLDEDTARIFYSSHTAEQPSRFPSYIPGKNIVYAFNGQELTHTWVTLHLARAAMQVYLRNKYPYDMQGTVSEDEQVLMRESSESMLLYALADAPLRRALDSTKEVFLAIMHKADPKKPFGTYFPNSSHVLGLCAGVSKALGADEAHYREQVLWRAVCFTIIDEFKLTDEEKHAQKIKFDRATRMIKKKPPRT